MTRCQHCDKLTHSEHVNVYYNHNDCEKIFELSKLLNWTHKYMYCDDGTPREEYGKLKCGDIILHFIQLDNKDK